MRIYLIGQKGIPAVGGGVENHVDNLARKLVESGHQVYAYTRYNYTDKKLKEYQGVKLIPLPSISTKSLDAISHTFLAVLNFIFRRPKADVIHFHSIGPASLIWLVKLFRPRVKVVFTFHSQCYHNSKWGKLAQFYLLLGERIGSRLADEVIVVSKSLKKYVEEKYNRTAHYIPNGVDLPKILEANLIKEKWGLNKDSYLVSISRLVRNKGIEHLINAYNQIKTDKKLVIVGDGNFSDSLKKLAADNNNIIFTGQQSGQILGELFSNAALFIQPSEAEGLSISLLEAISYRLPILISDIEANVEVMGPDAFSFANRDVEDLKNKLESFLAGEQDEAIDKNLNIVYNDKLKFEYSWDQIVLQTSKLYSF